jgi:DNA transformation protein and related proteins
MAGSSAFQRIERDVLRLCTSIPTGRVYTYADLGAQIDVPARRVAYIVSRLDSNTRSQTPVHRLVGTGGKLPRQPANTEALFELRGLGPASVQMLVQAGVTSSTQLRKTDLYKLYAKIKSVHPRTSINLLYALLGAVDDQDWRTVAKDRRTEVLMRLEDMGLL